MTTRVCFSATAPAASRRLPSRGACRRSCLTPPWPERARRFEGTWWTMCLRSRPKTLPSAENWLDGDYRRYVAPPL